MNTILIIYSILALVNTGVAFGMRVSSGSCFDSVDIVGAAFVCIVEGLLWLPLAYVRSLKSVYKEQD